MCFCWAINLLTVLASNSLSKPCRKLLLKGFPEASFAFAEDTLPKSSLLEVFLDRAVSWALGGPSCKFLYDLFIVLPPPLLAEASRRFVNDCSRRAGENSSSDSASGSATSSTGEQRPFSWRPSASRSSSGSLGTPALEGRFGFGAAPIECNTGIGVRLLRVIGSRAARTPHFC